jgi:hypothetical protein
MTPKWAQELSERALQYLGDKQHIIFIRPPIKWRHRPHYQSTGTCYEEFIVITAGTERKDCKLVLLHELAHWVHPEEHHSAAFWDTCLDLFQWAKLPVRYCKKREGEYMKGSIAAYHRAKNIKQEVKL